MFADPSGHDHELKQGNPLIEVAGGRLRSLANLPSLRISLGSADFNPRFSQNSAIYHRMNARNFLIYLVPGGGT